MPNTLEDYFSQAEIVDPSVKVPVKASSLLKRTGAGPGTQEWFKQAMDARQRAFEEEQQKLQKGGDGKDELPELLQVMEQFGRR